MGLHVDHKGMFLGDWWTELMRKDMHEALWAESPMTPDHPLILEEIDQTWPRAYVLTPPAIPKPTGGGE